MPVLPGKYKTGPRYQRQLSAGDASLPLSPLRAEEREKERKQREKDSPKSFNSWKKTNDEWDRDEWEDW